jgi:hypothetical protein
VVEVAEQGVEAEEQGGELGDAGVAGAAQGRRGDAGEDRVGEQAGVPRASGDRARIGSAGVREAEGRP